MSSPRFVKNQGYVLVVNIFFLQFAHQNFYICDEV